MNLLRLSIAYLRAGTLVNMLQVLLLAIGVAAIVLVLHLQHQLRQQMQRDGRGIDLVVSAKGSPLQSILSSIYHVDIPTGNIPLSEAQKLRNNPKVRQSIPLALGDSFHGFRVVGTEPAYIEHYQGTLSLGQMFSSPMQAVIGSTVAQQTGLTVGRSFAASHGLVKAGDVHTATPYTVTGVMAPTGSVLDRLILTPVQSVWQMHQHHHHQNHDKQDERNSAHEHGSREETDTDEINNNEAAKEITALLIKFKSPASAISLPREINRSTVMQAASPALEIARLFSLLGLGFDLISLFGWLVLGCAILILIVSVLRASSERMEDYALLRALGASKSLIVRQNLLENTLLLAAGAALGILFGHTLLYALPLLHASTAGLAIQPLLVLPEELAICATLVASGIVACCIPPLMSYRNNISQILARS